MPSFVIAHGSYRTGQTTDATLCEPNAVTGFPNRRSGVPVQINLVSERVLCVDGENRAIISTVGENGTTTYLVDGSSKAVRNRERRAALAKAAALLQQLQSCLVPLIATSEDGGLATEALQLLFDWTRDERELAAAAPRSVAGEIAKCSMQKE